MEISPSHESRKGPDGTGEADGEFFVGAQVPAISLVDEGPASVLDRLQMEAGVSTIIVPTHGFNPEVISRATSGHANHGVNEADGTLGGSFIEPRDEFYRGLLIEEIRTPESLYDGFDVLEALLAVAEERGIKVYAYLLEEALTGGKPIAVPRYPHLLEVDAFGRRAQLPCVNHPEYRAWKRALLEDMLKRYPIDGVLWGMERQGPLGCALGGSAPVCFCGYCEIEAERGGVDSVEARKGYLALYDFASRSRGPYVDGHLISFIRVLLEHPAILAWEMVWQRCHLTLAAELYGTAKWINSRVAFGLGIWHLYFIDPLLRAAWNLSDWVHFADFLRPIAYHNVAGPRLRRHLEELGRSVLGDAPADDWLRAWYAVLGLQGPPVSELVTSGFGPEYVRRVVEHVVTVSGGTVPIYAGIGVDVPDAELAKPMKPAHVRAAVAAAIAGGAAGITISRNYAEMGLPSLRAVGAALRDMGRTW